MIVWARPECAPPGTPFCVVVKVAASVHTACGGRWDARDPRAEHRDPPADERCRACARELEADAGDDEIAATFGEILAEEAREP